MTKTEILEEVWTNPRWRVLAKNVLYTHLWGKRRADITVDDLITDAAVLVNEKYDTWVRRHPNIGAESLKAIEPFLTKSIRGYWFNVCFLESIQSNRAYTGYSVGNSRRFMGDDFLSQGEVDVKMREVQRIKREWKDAPLSGKEYSELKEAWKITMEKFGRAKCRFC